MLKRQKSGRCLILLAGPSEGIREYWRSALEPQYQVCEASSLSELQSQLVEFRPSILLVDAAWKKAEGFVHQLISWSFTTKVVVLTEETNDDEAIAVLKEGACGYSEAMLDHNLFCRAIEMIQKGEIWISRKLVPRLISELRATRQKKQEHDLRFHSDGNAGMDGRSQNGQLLVTGKPFPIRGLTSREHEIAELVAIGGSNKEIASRLKITESTVKAHLTTIYRKIGVPDRLSLALLVSEYLRKNPQFSSAPQAENRSFSRNRQLISS